MRPGLQSVHEGQQLGDDSPLYLSLQYIVGVKTKDRCEGQDCNQATVSCQHHPQGAFNPYP